MQEYPKSSTNKAVLELFTQDICIWSKLWTTQMVYRYIAIKYVHLLLLLTVCKLQKSSKHLNLPSAPQPFELQSVDEQQWTHSDALWLVCRFLLEHCC
jgi:hypothetical protein